MKTTPEHFAASLEFSALHAAWRAYRSGKRRRREVAFFELDTERHLLHLAHRLATGSYRHGDYRLIEIRDPKPRLIAAASVADRIVHTAVYRALAPFFNRRLIDDTYACLPGRGSHRAILRFKEYQEQFPFMMHLDIRAYYPHIRHDILSSLLIPRLRDQQWRPLLDEILNSGARFYSKPRVQAFYGLAQKNAVEPVSEQPKRGLPIGNLTSQWWGNWYLNGLDHFAKRSLKARGYIRYMDDMVFFARDKRTLRLWREQVKDWLAAERDLEINLKKAHIRSTEVAHTYLGYRIARTGITLGPKAWRRMHRKLKAARRLSFTKRLRRATALKGAALF